MEEKILAVDGSFAASFLSLILLLHIPLLRGTTNGMGIASVFRMDVGVFIFVVQYIQDVMNIASRLI